jgi:hypothetical protein
MKDVNDGNHLTKCYRYYDKENRIFYYANTMTKLNNMIKAVEAGSVLNGGLKKVEEKQVIKTTVDEEQE